MSVSAARTPIRGAVRFTRRFYSRHPSFSSAVRDFRRIPTQKRIFLECLSPMLATRIRQKDGVFYFASFKAPDILSRVRFTSRFYFEGETIEADAEADDPIAKFIGSVERSERNVTLSTLEVLAKALDVTVPNLLTPR